MLTINEHCDSLRQKVDIAREEAIENIRKSSNTLITRIDAYEKECLSGWTPVKESTKSLVEEVSKRMRAFIAEQQAFLQSVQERDDELTLRLDEANKLAQELSDRKKELNDAMFSDKLVAFHAFPSMDETCILGELTFTTTKLPFKTLSTTDADLKPIDIRASYDFIVPLENGQRIVTFKSGHSRADETIQMSCFDRIGRLLGSNKLKCNVRRENVAQCAPNQFVVCHDSDSFKLSVFNSSLQRLRTVDCKKFSNICCNSKFVFGMWDAYDSFEADSDDDDDEQEEEDSAHRIQVHHLDTLSKAFGLRVPAKYSIERIWADEHQVVAMSRLINKPSRHWYMTIFDLATCNHSDTMQLEAKRARKNKSAAAGKLFLAEKHVLLRLEPCFFIDSAFLTKVFAFDGWLVFPHAKELVWFDKNGTRSEASTSLDDYKNMKELYSFGSILILTSNEGKLLLKR